MRKRNKSILAWKHEERALKKAKSRKWRKKSKKILVMINEPRHEHQKSRAEYIR